MLPHEKELVKRLKEQPFALIGINSDSKETLKGKTLKEMLAENDITWRQAAEGSTSGPLPKKWNVRSWPTIYVIDHKGVIRFKNVRDQAMEDAVVKLLDELKSEGNNAPPKDPKESKDKGKKEKKP
jgi:hypothetical protein